mgnify:FL=1
MARQLRTVLTNFSSGELNPLLAARTDAKAYFDGAKQCRNWYLLDEGGVMRRPGTEYKNTFGTRETRIIPFIFSNDEVAIFALSNNRLDVVDSNGANVQTNITSNCNWTTAQLFELNYAQFGDTVFITHRDNPIIEIKRTSATNFTVSLFAFEDDDTVTVNSINKTTQPFYKYANSTITLTPGATTGNSVTLTASSSVFVSAHNGTYLSIGGKQVKIVGFTNGTTVTATILEALPNTDANADWEEQLISAVRGFPQAVTFHDNRLWFGGIKDKPSSIIASQIGGYFNFALGTGLANESINVAIAGDRVNEVRHLVSSRNLLIFTDGGEYYSPSSADTAAITPSNIAFRRQTPYGCSRANPTMFDGATVFSQKNGKSIREYLYSDGQAAYSAESISVLSSQLIDNPKQIAMITGNDTRPEQFAFFVNGGSVSNGKIAVFHSIRNEKIAGWTMYETRSGDFFHSMTAANSNLFVVSKRQINGTTTYALEKFADDDSTTLDCQTSSVVYQKGSPKVNGASQATNQKFLIVDGFTTAPQVLETFTIAGNAQKYIITAVTTTSTGHTLTLDQNLAAVPSDNAVITIVDGYIHTVNSIYGQISVNAVFGNSSLGTYTIDNNDRITLNASSVSPRATGVKVGFNYTPILETMPIDKEIDSGPLTGQPRRITRCILDVNSALDVNVKAANNSAHELLITPLNFTIGSDMVAVTGKKEFNFLGYSKNPTITVSQNDPLPLKVLAMAIELQFV